MVAKSGSSNTIIRSPLGVGAIHQLLRLLFERQSFLFQSHYPYRPPSDSNSLTNSILLFSAIDIS
jgi:hypothetical protein